MAERARALVCAPFTPVIPVLDPFRLGRMALLRRASHLRGVGFRRVVLASTDDAEYRRVLPPLIATLRGTIGLEVIEHFRPCRRLGFRAQPETSWVLMSRVLSSRDPHYQSCARLNGAAVGPKGRGLSCIALPFGPDPKSAALVAAVEIAEIDVARLLRTQCRTPPDVVYLFSRHSRLRCETVAAARAVIGSRPFLVASGNVCAAHDVEALTRAGADGVALGSLLEGRDWRRRFDALLEPGPSPQPGSRNTGVAPGLALRAAKRELSERSE